MGGGFPGFAHIPAGLLIANLYFKGLNQLTDQEAFYFHPYYLLSGLLGHEGYRTGQKLEKRRTLLDGYQENFWFSYLFA